MNTTTGLSRTQNHKHQSPESGSPTRPLENTLIPHNNRLAEPHPTDHYTDMLQVVETALEEDDHQKGAGRLTLRQLRAQAAAADFTLVTHQDHSGLLIRNFTVRVELDDILQFETLAEAKTLLDKEMGAGA